MNEVSVSTASSSGSLPNHVAANPDTSDVIIDATTSGEIRLETLDGITVGASFDDLATRYPDDIERYTGPDGVTHTSAYLDATPAPADNR